MKTHIVRVLAGGCVIGGCLEDNFGNPLTARTARALAKSENERSARRREQKLAGCFDYYADSFDSQPTTRKETTCQFKHAVTIHRLH